MYIYRFKVTIILAKEIINRNLLYINHSFKNLYNIKYSSLNTAPFSMNINKNNNFQAIFTPELIVLKKIFQKYDHKLCLAGGPVRDLLMGLIPEDLDFATCATPSQMKVMFDKENIRMLNKNGELHGTITVRINEKQNFEITTLRIDVVTDGRHAEVIFTTNWHLDANRRDLTINSMFLDLDGNVYDFCGGKSDLDERKIVFVGDPATRIQEDYLRILRYFRFYGKIATIPEGHDPKVLEIIRNNASGLAKISGERLWVELKKICTGNFAHSLLTHIIKTGVGNYIGLCNVGSDQLAELKIVCQRASNHNPNPITILSALLKDFDDLKLLNKRLKLSNFELSVAMFIIEERTKQNLLIDIPLGLKVNDPTDPSLRPYINIILDAKSGTRPLERITEFLKYQGKNQLIEALNNCPIPKFPLTGHDLLAMGVKRSPKFAQQLQKLKEIWKDSDFKITREQLLQQFSSGDQ